MNPVLAQGVHVAIWYIPGLYSRYEAAPLDPKYILYTYIHPLGSKLMLLSSIRWSYANAASILLTVSRVKPSHVSSSKRE